MSCCGMSSSILRHLSGSHDSHSSMHHKCPMCHHRMMSCGCHHGGSHGSMRHKCPMCHHRMMSCGCRHHMGHRYMHGYGGIMKIVMMMILVYIAYVGISYFKTGKWSFY